MSKSILKNSIFNITYRLLNIVFPMITAMYVARILLPDGVGKVIYAQNIMNYFAIIAALGIPTYGAREIARYSHDRIESNKLFSELFILNLISTIISSVIYLCIILLIPSFHQNFELYLAVGIQLFLNIFNVDWYYSGHEEYVYITVRSTVIKIISIVFIFIFVTKKESTILYALISALAVSGNYLFNIWNLRNRVRLQLENLKFEKHLKPIVIMLITTIATGLYNQIDITLMGFYRTNSEIGYYSYAIRLIRIVISISTALSITTLPRLSQYYIKEDKIYIRELFNKTVNVILIIVLPCMVGILTVPKNLVMFIYGKSFIESTKILVMASPVIPVVAISYLCGSIILTAVNKEKYLLMATICGMTVNIVLNVILIPKYSGIGAAVSLLFTEIVVLMIHAFYSRQYVKLKIERRDFISLFISVIMLVIVVSLIKLIVKEFMLVLQLAIIFGAITYFGSLYILKNTVFIWIIDRLKMNKFAV